VGPEEQGDLLGAYCRRMASEDPAINLPAARAWSRYEGSCIALRPDPANGDNFEQDAVALGIGRLEAHYFQHQAFLRPNQLLDEMARIRHLPAFIVHGRYDVICPLRYAYALHDAWPGSVLQVIDDAGHTSYEPGIAQALVQATDRFARTGRFDQ
jgi:proline iminopeptidase